MGADAVEAPAIRRSYPADGLDIPTSPLVGAADQVVIRRQVKAARQNVKTALLTQKRSS